MSQRLQDLLSKEARNLGSSLPIIKQSRLVKIVRDAQLDLDRDELHQVSFAFITAISL